jgi:hypothetical protein
MNGLIAKTKVKVAYKHLPLKALAEFPQGLERISLELEKKKNQCLAERHGYLFVT